jgi:cytochrome c-type biogenesis protein CcmF
MFALPFVVAVVTGGVLLALGYGSSLPGILAYTFSAFVAVSIVLEFVRGGRAAGSIVRLVSRNRRRYGGYLVHAAVLLFAIGVAGSSAYQTVRERGLQPGQSLEVAGYTLTYQSLASTQASNHTAIRSTIDVSRNGSHVTTLHPGKNTYPVEATTSNEVAIYHDPRNIGDLFLIADQVDKNGTLYLKALVKPLVNLIWVAGFLFVFGALVAMWPDAVEQRRLAARYAAGAAVA